MQDPSAHFSVHLAREQIHDVFSTWGLFIFHGRALSETLSSTCCCCCSIAKLCMTLCDPMDYSIPGFAILTTSWSLLRFMSIESGMLSNYLILCCPLLFLPSIFPRIRVFSNESALHIRCPKHWSFTFSISPSNEYSELISFRMGWFDLTSVQGTLKSLLQHHSSKASILWHSAFFIFQLSHPYMTTGKPIALTRWPAVNNPIYCCLNRLIKYKYLLYKNGMVLGCED